MDTTHYTVFGGVRDVLNSVASHKQGEDGKARERTAAAGDARGCESRIEAGVRDNLVPELVSNTGPTQHRLADHQPVMLRLLLYGRNLFESVQVKARV